MRCLWLLILLIGCSSAGPRFFGTTPVRAMAGGHVFDIYRKEDRVQVIRLNRAAFPALEDVVGAAVLAVRDATGCDMKEGSIKGDVALLNARLRCG